MQNVTRDMRRLTGELHELEEELRSGGGAKKIEKQHREGKWTARERVDRLIDRGIRFLEIGLLVAYAIAFVLENRGAVRVHFVLTSAHVSLVWLILLALGVGLLGGILLAQLERRRRRRSHQAPEH